MSEINPQPDGVETEADGLRADALRIAQYQHQARQMRERIAVKPVSPEQLQERDLRRQELERKKSEAIANAERDAPIRVRFHAWLEKSGYRTMPIPEPGRSYSGSHVQTLWEAYLDATLNERRATTIEGESPMEPRPQNAHKMQYGAIANQKKPGRPPLRKLTDKPSARRKFRITIDYGHDIHSVMVPAKTVDQIKRGEAVTVSGQGFYVEGEKTKDVWSFHRTGPNELEVDGADGHQIYIGKVSDAIITDDYMSAELQSAFEETHYIVHHKPPLTLRVGKNSPELDALLRASGTDCAAFITAWNPMSQALSDAENHRRQQELMADLDRLELPYLLGIGQHPANGWPGEESVLVLGLQLEAARSMAKGWEQLAFIWTAQGKPVQLIETNESF